MAKLCLKKATKRKSFAKQYKIQKKVKEHKRKTRREQKKNKQKAATKPLTVPNACPFKEELLVEAERSRELLKEQREAKKEAARLQDIERRAEKRKLPTDTMESLAARAELQAKKFANGNEVADEGRTANLDDKSVKVYAAEVRKTIETADVVIEVLDARDPLGSRSKVVEQQVVNAGKRLVLLLNKIDLVPKENVLAWLKYLRQFYPTIAFKASTQEQNSKLGRFGGSNLSNSSSAKCIGADLIMKLLGNYCRNKDIKTSIRVGLVGYPNVGKSSVINSLKRKRACNVGATPGVTKQIQEVELDKNIRLLDSPGVVLATKSQLDTVEVALRNAIRVESLADPVAPVHAILRRCSKETLMLHYTIAEFDSCDKFLSLVARKLGRLKKGGVADVDAAARHVLQDWNTGRLRYYTQPPEQPVVHETTGAAEIVQQFSKEFDIDSLDTDLANLVEELPMETSSDVATAYSGSEAAVSERWGEEGESEDDDEEMDDDTKGGKVVIEAGAKKAKPQAEREKNVIPESLALGGNVQHNRAIKQAVKKQKRQNRKTAQRADALADAMDVGLSTKQEEYDFSMA
ncbi:unnamed protein product, partial [Mesorhabditis spiculigera]